MFRSLKNQNFLKAGGVGVAAALFYSLTPLFVFFFKGDSHETMYAIFLATVQELVSFLFVGTAFGFNQWKENLTPQKKWLSYTLIVPTGYMVGVGVYQATKDLFGKLKNLQVWLMCLVGLIAGPISMTLLMISALYLNDGTLGNVILNTAPIYCMILSRFILKDKINKTAVIGIVITTLLTFGMLFNYFFIQETINWKLIVGVVISFVAALAYALEGLTSDYFLHNRKIQLNNYEVVTTKSFISFWVMLIVVLPISSTINAQPAYFGWTMFKLSFDDFGWLAILVYVSGIGMGIGRLLYFKAVKLSTGTYALATQLTMLIWTPVLQILGNALIPSIETAKLAWYYWIWSVLILISLIIITFNDQIHQWFVKKKEKEKAEKIEKN